jgi:hypothetical protein
MAEADKDMLLGPDLVGSADKPEVLRRSKYQELCRSTIFRHLC